MGLVVVLWGRNRAFETVIRTEKTMTATDVARFDAFFSAQIQAALDGVPPTGLQLLR